MWWSFAEFTPMTVTVDKEEYDGLRAQVEHLAKENEQLHSQLHLLREQVQLARYNRFAASSERSSTAQTKLHLFDEPEAEADPEQPEPDVETITYKRKKRAGRRPELEGLPVERVEYRLPSEEQICPSCQGPLHEMSTEVRREFKVVPIQMVIVEHVQHLYACRACEKGQETTPIVKAPMPRPLQSGSLASPSAVSYLMAKKFQQGLPLYRQEKEFATLGIRLSRQTMANWILHSSQTYLERIYERLHEDLVGRRYLHADETTVQVLHEPGRRAEQTSYMWLYRSGRDGPKVVLYDYEQTRQAAHPRRFLSGFEGYLHVDGYAGYHDLPGVKLVGCWAHARRKFDEAVKALPAKRRAGQTAAEEGLAHCNRLFGIERRIGDASPEERRRVREADSAKALTEFRTWLEAREKDVLPQSALGRAVNYCLTQWPKLTAFLEDGNLEIDNNAAERAIKPFVIGRKNWLFANTPRGARASAVVYSLVETAKENGLDPQRYLEHVLTRLPKLEPEDKAGLDELLPWSDALRQKVRGRR